MTTTKFDEILAAEDEVRVMKTIIAFWDARVAAFERERHMKSLDSAKEKLSTLVDSLSMDELRAFGEYRKGSSGEV